MKKLFIGIILGIFLISLSSAGSFAYNYLESTNPTGTTDLSKYYTIIQVNAINTSMKNYVDSLGTGGISLATAMNGTLAKTSDLTNYVSYAQLWLQVYNETEVNAMNTSMNNYVLALKTSNNNYMLDLNTSNNNYIVYTNGTMKAYVDTKVGADLAPYVTWTNLWTQVYNKTEISLINDSMRNYVLALNSSNNNYIIFANSSLKDYIDTRGYLTNSTMNKTVHCSNIIGSPDTDFCTDATGSASGGLTEWINTSSVLYTSINQVPTYIEGLNVTLQPNKGYIYNCRMIFASNITTNGIRVGVRVGTNVPSMNTDISIPQAAAGTDSYNEWQSNTNFPNVTSTAVISTAVNYTAQISGEIFTNGVQNYMIPYFGAENTSRLTNVTRATCRWTVIY